MNYEHDRKEEYKGIRDIEASQKQMALRLERHSEVNKYLSPSLLGLSKFSCLQRSRDDVCVFNFKSVGH